MRNPRNLPRLRAFCATDESFSAAEPLTESVLKGKTTYYRARFAGLDKDKAEAACKFLKRNDVECIAIKN